MSETESNKKRIAKNTAFLYVRMLIVMLVTFFTSRVVLQALGEVDYGIYNVVGGVVTIMSFLNGSLSSSTSRFLTYELGKKDFINLSNTFSASLNLHLAVAILVVLLGETVGVWFLYNKMTIPATQINAAFWVLQFSIVTTFFSFTQVPYNASIISHENMSIFAYVGLYEAFSRLAIAYLIQLNGSHRLVLYSALLMINGVVVMLFYRYYTSRKYHECSFRLIKDKNLYRKLLSYSGWDLYGNLGAVCQGQGINIVLNIFFGPVVNAARAVAVQVQTGLNQFVNNFLVAARPRVVKYYAEENYESMFKLTFYSCKLSYFLLFALVLPVAFEMNFILKIWLGNEVPEMTNIFAWIMLAMSLSDTIHRAFLMAYHAVGKIKYGNLIGGSLMILSLPAGYLALKHGMPAYSVFIICLLFNFISHIICWKLLHDEVSFSYILLIRTVYWPCIAVSVLAIIVPAILITYIPSGWLQFFAVLFSSELILLTLIMTIGLNKQERQELITPIIKKIKDLSAK